MDHAIFNEDNPEIKLFVPESITSSVDVENCELDDYKEVFFNDSQLDFKQLKWRQKTNYKHKPCYLEVIHDFNYNTFTSIKFILNEIELYSINVTKLTGVKYISKIQKISSKQVSNSFYLIFKFERVVKTSDTRRRKMRRWGRRIYWFLTNQQYA